jgi:Fe-S-cluster containining protein
VGYDESTAMNVPSSPLAVLESCDGCGACCRVVTLPPFRRPFGAPGEERWERLGRERPDLAAELLTDDRARRARGAPDYGTPCTWFDADTLRCRHYEYRPRACHEFAVGGVDCRDARRRAGVDHA